MNTTKAIVICVAMLEGFFIGCANRSTFNSTDGGVKRPQVDGENANSGESGGPVASPNSKPTASPTPAQCLEDPVPLPEKLTELVEMFHWKASGVTSAYTNVMVTPVVGKIVSDKPSIVAVAYAAGSADSFDAGSVVYAIDGLTGNQQWVAKLTAFHIAAALGDIDGDGLNEVVVVGIDGYVYALAGFDGSVKWRSDAALLTDADTVGGGSGTGRVDDFRAYATSLADIDGDGAVEIINVGKVFDGKTGRLKFQLSMRSPEETLVGHVSNHAVMDIITSSGVFSGKDGGLICHFERPIDGMAFGRLSSSSDVVIVGSEPFSSGSGFSNVSGYVRAYRGSDCSLVFSTAFTGGRFAGLVTLADLDGDGKLEIGVPGVEKFTVLKSDGTMLWQADTDDGPDWHATGSTAFDFNGDGRTEIIYNSVGELKILDGSTGRVIYQISNSNYTMLETPVVADINGDGHAEIVVVSSIYPGIGSDFGVRVFRAPKNDWVGTRQIWNQATYSITNVGDNGQLVGFDAAAIWKDQVTNEFLLGFRNNVSIRPRKKDCE